MQIMIKMTLSKPINIVLDVFLKHWHASDLRERCRLALASVLPKLTTSFVVIKKNVWD